MKRTTIVLSDELATLLDLERKRRDTSVTEIVREALDAYLKSGSGQTKRLRIAALGRSGHSDTAREVEAIIDREWGDAGDP